MVLQEEAAKILLAEFNLGCDVQHTEHVYRVYVTTFLGFGGNFARQRYEDLVLNETLNKNRYIWHGICVSEIECCQVADIGNIHVLLRHILAFFFLTSPANGGASLGDPPLADWDESAFWSLLLRFIKKYSGLLWWPLAGSHFRRHSIRWD